MLLKEYGFEQIFNTYLQALRSKGEETEAKLVDLLRVAGEDKKKLNIEFYRKCNPEKYAKG